MDAAETGFLPIDEAGHRVYYERYGEGEPLLCLHGGPGSNLVTTRPYAALAASGLEVICYDQLGGGRSDRPDDDRLWTLERFVAEVEAVRAGLELGAVHVLGRSWGAMLGLQYTLDHPQAVRSLVFSNAGASAIDIWRSITRRRSELPDAVLRTMLTHEAAGSYDAEAYQDASWEFTARWLRRATPFDPARSVAEAREVLGTLEEHGRPYAVMWGHNEFTVTGNLISWDVSGRLGEVGVPVLVVTGLYDEIDVDVHRKVAEALPDAEFAILGQSSHLIVFEKEAGLYLDVVGGFLRRHSGSGQAVG
jgi:proline iminopeptidase